MFMKMLFLEQVGLVSIAIVAGGCVAHHPPSEQLTPSKQPSSGGVIDAEFISPPPPFWTFSGRLAFMDSAGRMHPVHDATFWCEHHEAPGCEVISGPVSIPVDDNGFFQLLIDDSNWWAASAVYSIRAPGCNDTVVRVGHDSNEHTNVMNCPGRRSAQQ